MSLKDEIRYCSSEVLQCPFYVRSDVAVIPVAALRARLKELERQCSVQSSYEARVASNIYARLLKELEDGA